jgi:hypothetical protein
MKTATVGMLKDTSEMLRQRNASQEIDGFTNPRNILASECRPRLLPSTSAWGEPFPFLKVTIA